MDKELKIEHYLAQLERQLKPLPLSQRAEIIIQVKSNIRASADLDPRKEIERILSDLGPAKAVAEHYLTARGVRPNAVRRGSRNGDRGGSWVKWLAIGTVAFFGFVFLAGMAAIWYLSPLIKVDGAHGRVTLLGGMIDVNKELGEVKVGNLSVTDAFDDKNAMESVGVSEFAGHHIKLLRIPFNTAKLEVVAGKTARLTWKCQSSHNGTEPKVEFVGSVATLNLDTLNLARCLISLPFGMATEIRGVNGHMDIEKPLAALDVQLSNGKVNVKADPKSTYDFDVSVKNGLQDFFPRSANPNAVRVKISVTNGMVKKE